MSLQTEPPLRVRQTVLHSKLGVLFPCGPIHRLQEEVPEVEVGEAFRFRSLLRKDQLEFMSRTEYKLRPGFRADAHPIDATGRRLRAVRFNGDLEAELMQGRDKIIIELQQRFTTSADNEAADVR